MPSTQTPLVELIAVTKVFGTRRIGRAKAKNLVAVNNVSISVNRGETLGIVGETGSGKSTLGRILLGLEEPTSGTLIIEGKEIRSKREREKIGKENHFQMVFQDPAGSLNPQMNIQQILSEALQSRDKNFDVREVGQRLTKALEEVELNETYLSRNSYQLSGGQQQRIANARALLTQPQLLLLDEAVSALDAVTQSNLLALLKRLQVTHNLTYIFISHDLEAVAEMATRTAVMYQGQIIEIGDSEQIFNEPQHPYTRGLRSAIPIKNPQLAREQRSLFTLNVFDVNEVKDTACCFIERCPIIERDRCTHQAPELISSDSKNKHLVACHYYKDFAERRISYQRNTNV
jgi:oligopeptide/dipeptide ABC transporter ATP-binding protein